MAPLTGSKPELASKGIWGSYISIAASGLIALSQWVSTPSVLATFPVTILPYVGIAGGVLAYIGRKYAKEKINGGFSY